DMTWHILRRCIQEGNKELCQSIIKASHQQLGQASPPHAQRLTRCLDGGVKPSSLLQLAALEAVSSFVESVAAQLCDLIAGEPVEPDAITQRDAPARQRLLWAMHKPADRASEKTR
ncbi:hypothetical protein WJX84_008095, partial [Apatococcus fuscideae]